MKRQLFSCLSMVRTLKRIALYIYIYIYIYEVYMYVECNERKKKEGKNIHSSTNVYLVLHIELQKLDTLLHSER